MRGFYAMAGARATGRATVLCLAHVPAKWPPVRRKGHAPIFARRTEMSMTENPANRVVLRRLEPEDVPVIAQFEREIAEISFPEDPVTDLAFYERKLNQAVTD